MLQNQQANDRAKRREKDVPANPVIATGARRAALVDPGAPKSQEPSMHEELESLLIEMASKKGSLLQEDLLAAVFALRALRKPEQQPLLSAVLTVAMKVQEGTASSHRGSLTQLAWLPIFTSSGQHCRSASPDSRPGLRISSDGPSQRELSWGTLQGPKDKKELGALEGFSTARGGAAAVD
ncbi:hypothetical protein, conserved [Eimeria acervulina]|uniref:Uncharacterized protein n=1 Tax=Eimeria acervulina TaxID=5801 RepID=U6GRZ1_EIMAC|nr:hypothetical protein, conserved [Eimeria acervulina]CDI81374.1 hypothetical protein, conserved [Eimeria acervulina]